MSLTWTPLLFTFAGTTLLVGTALSVAYEAFFRYPVSVRQRLNELAGKSRSEKSSLLLDLKQLADSASQAPADWRTWVRDCLEQSGLKITAQTLLASSLGLGIAAALLAAALTQRWWTAPLALAAGGSLPWLYVHGKRLARLRRLTQQLPDALDIICRAVRAGQTVPAAFQMVADDFSAPIADEFRYCCEQQNLGISFETALRNLARSVRIMELKILIVALLIQSRSGGNLAELLQNLATTVRKRLVLQQKVKALTGEGRMQAVVLIALPLVVFAAMYLLNREYAQVLLDRPWLLVGCLVSQTLGAVMIRKMIQIDY